jgi:uncharacterized membrane protein YoaK (UPF0700 family)
VASSFGRLPDVAESRTGRSAARAGTASTLLALVSGVVDLWAVSSLGGPFASVVTGNLVVAGGAVGRGGPSDAWPPLIAVLGFALGVATWSLAGRRRPSAVAGPLAAELVVLVGLSVVWMGSGAAPTPGIALVLLGAAALAMGAQSSTALRLGESTTYLTGTLTAGVVALVAGGPRARVAALRQLAAVAVGAAAAALVLGIARPWVPALAVVLLVAALAALGRPDGQDVRVTRDDRGRDARVRRRARGAG